MRILIIGDVVGKPGRTCVRHWVSELNGEQGLDLVVANGENAAGGLGATPDVLEELFQSGVHVVTLGNHTWRKRELAKALDGIRDVVRPANYAEGVPGKGSLLYGLPDGRQIGIVNLVGRVFMEPAECPFLVGMREVHRLRETTPIVLVDFHAEATAEKVAMGWYLDGHCTAVLGTHTHVQTADERVLPQGTAYITDIGMTGPHDSVIGVEYERAVGKFLNGMPVEFRVAKGRPRLNAVLVEVDETNGTALSIQRMVRPEG